MHAPREQASMMRTTFMTCLLLAASPAFASPTLATPAGASLSPVVVELFTSESCSSCPPADALLAGLAHDPSLLPLAFHVDYWNQLNWRDRFSSPAATARQRDYAATLGSGVYTPQIVVNGTSQAVGSDQAAVHQAIQAARAAANATPLSLTAASGHVAVHVGAGAGSGTLLLIGFDHQHTTSVGGGENDGRTLLEANVVRSMQQIGQWDGAARDVMAEMPAGERVAVLLQAPDGRILAAAATP
jgi:hypothetical protein